MRKLVIVDDEGRKTTVPLVRSEITIGRLEGNTIRLTERNVSRTHARIYREDERYFVEDKSRYGTKKNGRKLLEVTPFDQGDVIIIGTYRLQLQAEAVDVDDAHAQDVSAPTLMRASERANVGAAATLDRPVPIPVFDAPAAATKVRGRLICLTEPFLGSEFEFTANELSIGTDPSCDLIIEHPSIASRHARFTDDNGYAVDPIDPGYPVAVNGKYNPSGSLKSGDEVLLGELKFRYCLPGEAFSLVGLDDIEDDFAPAARPAWLLPAIGLAAVVLIIGLMTVMGGGEPEDSADEPASEDASASLPENPAADSLNRGQAHMNSARWAEAINELDSIDDDATERERADSMIGRAENELFNAEKYESAVSAFDEGDYQQTLRALGDIPAGTYYRTRAEDENLERRAIDAIVNQRLDASRASQDDGDMAGARSVLVEIQPLAPQNAAIQARLNQLDIIQNGGGPAEREEPSERDVEREQERETEREEERETEREEERETEREEERETEREEERETEREEERETEREPVVAQLEPERSEPEPEPEPEVDDREARSSQASDLRQRAARAGVQQNFQEAIRLLEEARELNPGDAQINLMLFSNYRQVGNRSRAARAIRRYLRQRPNDPRRAEYEEWLTENAPD
ncbi:MAG: pSer/pThr/pTyr-binding forkhead associated (FHA) protein [Bradymonadia bacterium]|jgi:pSer/pThr/pTyr-binding forkhead associated (FHA) protein/outer membrane protein assembly factor BamD (BamD/ComL family)